MTDPHSLRREVERLLGSKNECSPLLHREGTRLIREHEDLLAIETAARQLVRRDISLEVVALCEANLIAALAAIEARRAG